MHYNEGKTKGMKYDKSMDNRLLGGIIKIRIL